jgi:dienelactone hydrolase
MQETYKPAECTDNCTQLIMKNLLIRVLVSSVTAGAIVLNVESQTRSRIEKRGVAFTATSLPDGVSARDVAFFSEGIQCYGRIFTPAGFSTDSKAPAVVVAPGWGEIESSVESIAAGFASAGLVAMAIDYRGWGKSGGFLQTVDAVKTDDRLRFSQMTARVRIRRKRLIPQQQILDIRNALYFLQGESGVDRTRVGVWGTGMAGGHVIVITATDARVKAVVADSPVIEGRDIPRMASAPTGAMLKQEQRRARSDTDIVGSNDIESRLALNEYHPFWYLEQVPKTAPILFVVKETDLKSSETADAASKRLTGSADVIRVPGGVERGSKTVSAASKAAADWFLKHL